MKDSQQPGSSGGEVTVPEAAIEIVDEGPCKRRFRAEIPADRVDLALDDNYQKLRKTIQLPGFRKGRVPVAVLRGRFGKQVEEDVKEELISQTFQEESERRELRVLGVPNFENIEFEGGAPLRYEATFEVAPEFELADYEGLAIDPRPVQVALEDVDRELEGLREGNAVLAVVPPGEQERDDVAFCAVALDDAEGETVIERPDVALKIGVDRVDNIVVENLSERLLAAQPDEEMQFSVSVPSEFPVEELRDSTATLRIRFQEAKRRQLPDLDEEFLGRFGAESEEALRSEIEKNLETRRRVQEENRQEEVLVERLTGETEMELPESVLERRKQEIMMGRRYRFAREGRSEEEAEKAIADDASIEQEAREELKRIFVLDRIADRENILVTEEEVSRRIAAIAVTSQREPAEVFEEYRSSGLLDDLRAGMRREKVRGLIRKKAKVTVRDGTGPADGSAEDAAARPAGENAEKEKRDAIQEDDADGA